MSKKWNDDGKRHSLASKGLRTVIGKDKVSKDKLKVRCPFCDEVNYVIPEDERFTEGCDHADDMKGMIVNFVNKIEFAHTTHIDEESVDLKKEFVFEGDVEMSTAQLELFRNLRMSGSELTQIAESLGMHISHILKVHREYEDYLCKNSSKSKDDFYEFLDELESEHGQNIEV